MLLAETDARGLWIGYEDYLAGGLGTAENVASWVARAAMEAAR
jgi:hypothetical protein